MLEMKVGYADLRSPISCAISDAENRSHITLLSPMKYGPATHARRCLSNTQHRRYRVATLSSFPRNIDCHARSPANYTAAAATTSPACKHALGQLPQERTTATFPPSTLSSNNTLTRSSRTLLPPQPLCTPFLRFRTSGRSEISRRSPKGPRRRHRWAQRGRRKGRTEGWFGRPRNAVRRGRVNDRPTDGSASASGASEPLLDKQRKTAGHATQVCVVRRHELGQITTSHAPLLREHVTAHARVEKRGRRSRRSCWPGKADDGRTVSGRWPPRPNRIETK